MELIQNMALFIFALIASITIIRGIIWAWNWLWNKIIEDLW